MSKNVVARMLRRECSYLRQFTWPGGHVRHATPPFCDTAIAKLVRIEIGKTVPQVESAENVYGHELGERSRECMSIRRSTSVIAAPHDREQEC
jgi:hypothetical protein